MNLKEELFKHDTQKTTYVLKPYNILIDHLIENIFAQATLIKHSPTFRFPTIVLPGGNQVAGFNPKDITVADELDYDYRTYSQIVVAVDDTLGYDNYQAFLMQRNHVVDRLMFIPLTHAAFVHLMKIYNLSLSEKGSNTIFNLVTGEHQFLLDESKIDTLSGTPEDSLDTDDEFFSGIIK